MHFRKLFKVLVLGGAVAGMGATAGCRARAEEPEKKKDKADAGASDAGTKKPADEGGGVQGW
jgi:hypothetical protein